MSKIICYARTSTSHQDLGIKSQIEILGKYNPDFIYSEQISGRKAKRPELSKALRRLKRGDTLLVYRLDRLGRSSAQLLKISSQLEKRGIYLKSIHDKVDTSTINGRFFFTILSAVAQLEAELNSQRVKDALQVSDKTLGRPRISDEIRQSVRHEYLEQKASAREIAKRYNISFKTVYNMVK